MNTIFIQHEETLLYMIMCLDAFQHNKDHRGSLIKRLTGFQQWWAQVKKVGVIGASLAEGEAT